ncbi:MAG: type I-G CRISPR-associated protein Csb2 [Actinomycetota bacterium]
MGFRIVADLPLGTYRGRSGDGRAERLPSLARLHSALLCAAGFGTRAVADEDQELQPLPADEQALRWLEDNPPDAVLIPPLRVNSGAAVAYRDDGTLKKSKAVMGTKKSSKLADASVAVGGSFIWAWREQPPREVLAAFIELCGDVPYLGTSESPVRLRVIETADADDADFTHDRDPDASLFSINTIAVDHPASGRTNALKAAHRVALAEPTVTRDKFGTDEKSSSPAPAGKQRTVHYRKRARSEGNIPWSHAVVLPVVHQLGKRVFDVRHRVRWAVAVHRALVSTIGEGAPSAVTGIYGDGESRSANRVALHFLSADAPLAGERVQGREALVVLLPYDLRQSEAQVVFEVLGQIQRVRGPGGQIARFDVRDLEVLHGSRFWRAPEPEAARWWRTEPAAVPDNRGPGGRDWTFGHAALLSLAYTWKDQLPKVPGRRAEYWNGMVASVADRGAAVRKVAVVRTSDPRRYVHRVNESAVVRPYEVELSMGDLGGSTTVVAIGQSRHLGGGLLVPVDERQEVPS